MIKGALEADGRLAAKNAVKIRAALRQVADFKRVFERYQETMPQPTDNPTQDRVRARSWIMLNVYINDEPLRLAVTRAWKDAFILGDVAAQEWIRKTREAKKADDIEVNWDNWKPGDLSTALRISGFEDYLIRVNADSYFKKFNKETIVNLGTALSDSIAAGLDAESAAVMISKHVASPSRALTIAITEQNRAMSFSSTLTYKNAGLQKMEWAVSDPCDICAKNDGQVIVIGQTFASGDTQPPAHPHCRCVLLPVIPGMEDDDPMGIDGGLAPMPDGAAIVDAPVEIAPPTKQGSNPRNLEAELSKMFAEETEMGEFKDKALVQRLQQMERQDLATGGSVGDNQLKIIAEMQGFDGKPQLVETIDELIAKQNAGEGKVVWRGLSDYSKDVEDGILDPVPKISYTAQQGVDEFMTGEYRGGWGSFGSGTYSTTEMTEAMGYARGVSEGQMGNGQTMAMLIPSDANMPTKEVVKATFRETMDNPAFGGGYNIGRALAAKGYQAYDVGYLQDNKSGIYVILDRSMLTVAKETRR
jgi:hypothetical protein